jgi:tetratricopeptide (TPR) repeat protein
MLEEADKYFLEGDYKKALKLFENIQQSIPNSLVIFHIGRCHYELKEFEKSLKPLKEAYLLFKEQNAGLEY